MSSKRQSKAVDVAEGKQTTVDRQRKSNKQETSRTVPHGRDMSKFTVRCTVENDGRTYRMDMTNSVAPRQNVSELCDGSVEHNRGAPCTHDKPNLGGPHHMQKTGQGGQSIHETHQSTDQSPLETHQSAQEKDNSADEVQNNKNLKFYMNEIESEPSGAKIENILQEWYGNYRKLEEHHGYIQWLFPLNERGVNSHSQELEPHEAKAISQSRIPRERFIRAYKMMLDFYGLRLVDPKLGTVERSASWLHRLAHLNSSHHNFLRITRIIRCMDQLGFAHLQAPFVDRLVTEAFVRRTLDRACESCLMFWIPAVVDGGERDRLHDVIDRAGVSRRATRSIVDK